MPVLARQTKVVPYHHTYTLADETPKARRRVRKLLNLAAHVLVTQEMVHRAQEVARKQETKSRRKEKAA